jgi:hypothetical protein
VNGEFFLTAPVERLPYDSTFKPMRQTKKSHLSLSHAASRNCKEKEEVRAIANAL